MSISSLDTLRTLYRLKDEPRTGWKIRGVVEPESVADHSWATAPLCLLYADEADVDRDHAVRSPGTNTRQPRPMRRALSAT